MKVTNQADIKTVVSICCRPRLDPAPEDQNLDIEDESDERVVDETEEGELGSSKEEGEVAGCSLADSLGYRGDREKIWLPPHSVSSVGPKIVWARGNAPCRALDFFNFFFF